MKLSMAVKKEETNASATANTTTITTTITRGMTTKKVTKWSKGKSTCIKVIAHTKNVTVITIKRKNKNSTGDIGGQDLFNAVLITYI